jgi:hypothetical protein
MEKIIYTILENGRYGPRQMTEQELVEHEQATASSPAIEPQDRIE